MKLHLPKGLRRFVCFCTAISSTLPVFSTASICSYYAGACLFSCHALAYVENEYGEHTGEYREVKDLVLKKTDESDPINKMLIGGLEGCWCDTLCVDDTVSVIIKHCILMGEHYEYDPKMIIPGSIAVVGGHFVSNSSDYYHGDSGGSSAIEGRISVEISNSKVHGHIIGGCAYVDSYNNRVYDYGFYSRRSILDIRSSTVEDPNAIIVGGDLYYFYDRVPSGSGYGDVDIDFFITSSTVYDVFGGNWVKKKASIAHQYVFDSSMSQGRIELQMNGGKLLGNIYASGLLECAARVDSYDVAVKLEGVDINWKGRKGYTIVSGGYLSRLELNGVTMENPFASLFSKDRSRLPSENYSLIEIRDDNQWSDNETTKGKGVILLNFNRVELAEWDTPESGYFTYPLRVAGLLLSGYGQSGAIRLGKGELLLDAGVITVDWWAEKDGKYELEQRQILNNSPIIVEKKAILRVEPSQHRENILQGVTVESGGVFKVQEPQNVGESFWNNLTRIAVRDSITFKNNSELQVIMSLAEGNTGESFNGVIYKSKNNFDGYTSTSPTAVIEGTLNVSITFNNVFDVKGHEVLVVLVDHVDASKAKLVTTRVTEETIRKWFVGGSIYIDSSNRLVLRGLLEYELEQDDTDEEEEEEENKPDPTPPPSEEEEIIPGPTPPPPGPPTPPDEPGYHEENSKTPGGDTGGKLLDEFYPDPSDDSPDRDKVLESVFDSNVDKDYDEGDRLMAAVAGSSIPALGMAMADDVERQLRLMRNRATGGGAVGEDKPEVRDGKGGLVHEATFAQRNTVWINGESDYRDISADRTNAGYKMNSWGGTFGVAHTTRKGIDLGLAVTAMYGDFTSHGPDQLKADTETYYLSGFAQVERGKWSHTLVATVGMTNLDGDRTVQIGRGYGSYTTQFETDGYLLGVLYELGYSIALNRSHTAYLQPVANVSWRHVEINGFTESGSDAALRAGDQTLDNVTVGAGARLYGEVSRNVLNRPIQLEARALVKYYGGDAQNQVEVGFADRAARGKVQSREYDKLGVELGGSITVPLRSRSIRAHAIFMDANSELRGAYTNLNATLGYKVQF